MISAHDLLRRRLHERAGLVDKPKPRFTLNQLAREQWSREFERLRSAGGTS